MKYKGTLSVHCEMCCGSWPQFHDDRGLDENGYLDWDWTINLGRKTYLKNIKLTDSDGKVLYNNSWTYNSCKSIDQGFYFPTPSELDFNQWVALCRKNLICEIETDIVVKALKEIEDG